MKGAADEPKTPGIRKYIKSKNVLRVLDELVVFPNQFDTGAFLINILYLYSLRMVTSTSESCNGYQTVLFDWMKVENSVFLFSLIGVVAFNLIYKLNSLYRHAYAVDDVFRLDTFSLDLNSCDRSVWVKAEAQFLRSNDFMETHKD